MATVFENQTDYGYTTVPAAPISSEAALHNARINERYRQLQNAEASQLAESYTKAANVSYAERAQASVLAPERPSETYAPESAPARESFEPYSIGHTRVDSPLFTTETLERTLGGGYVADRPDWSEKSEEVLEERAYAAASAFGEVAPMPVAAVNAEAREESYGLTRFAKTAIAAFAVTVTVMLAVIGINTQVIRNKTMRIRDLEQKKERLIEENAEIESRILEEKSYESVAEWAESHGMIYQPE